MMFSHYRSRFRFVLDQCFFKSSNLTKLRLTAFEFNPDGPISWDKLVNLYFEHVNLEEDLFENIISGSPVLETLELEVCFGYTWLNIISKSVKKLVISGYMYDDDVIEINAPNLFSLKIHGYLCMRKLLLINVSSLNEADLDYKLSGDYEITRKEVEDEMLTGFITKLLHVKEVKIGDFCLKAMSRLAAKGFIFPSNVKFCGHYYPIDSDSDSDESSDSDDPNGDELQERVDDATNSSHEEEDDDGDDDDETDA